MTEEQKQALIQRILNIKTSGKANRFEITELAEIALASLTAQPVRRPKNIGPGYASVALSTRDEQWYDAIGEAGYEVQE